MSGGSGVFVFFLNVFSIFLDPCCKTFGSSSNIAVPRSRITHESPQNYFFVEISTVSN